MNNRTLVFLLLSLFLGACGAPYTMEEVNVQNGVVVGVEQVEVDGSGQVTEVSEDGQVDNRYLDTYEDGGKNPGPSSPDYIPEPNL